MVIVQALGAGVDEVKEEEARFAVAVPDSAYIDCGVHAG